MTAEDRNKVRFRRSEIVKERTKSRRGFRALETHEQRVAEVEGAMRAFRRTFTTAS